MDKFVVKRLRTDQSSLSSVVQLSDRLSNLTNAITVTADVHAASDVPVDFKNSESPLPSRRVRS
jgi:hypothetical protein